MNYLLAATVATLPLLVPRGPAGSAPVDILAALFIAFCVFAAATGRLRVRAPAGYRLFGIVAATSIAVAFSVQPSTGLKNMFIDVYLFVLFFLACSVLSGDERRLRMVLTVWSVACLFWALLLVGVQYHFLPHVLQKTLISFDSGGSARAAGTSRNPNLAASYLVTSVFVLMASPWPRRMIYRLAALGWVILAVVSSGSNGALVGLLVGLVVLGVRALRQRTSRSSRLATAGLALVLVAAVGGAFMALAGGPRLGLNTVSTIASSQRGGPLASSVGRLGNSVSIRLAIWSHAWQGASSDILTGVGPGESLLIKLPNGQLNRGLHNDYLAFLLERGVLGIVAFVIFLAAVFGWCRVLLRRNSGAEEEALARERKAGRASQRPIYPAGLAAGVFANLAIMLTHESWHFRHVWLLLALTWAAAELRRRKEPAVVEAAWQLPAAPERELADARA